MRSGLPAFRHPEKAVYIFGPEDGGLDRAWLTRCHRFVRIPTRHCLNLACAVRYDCWLLIPLICVLLLVGDRDRIAGVTRSVCYGLLALPFVAAWMQGNERAKGDPFAPLRYIESFHRGWVAEGVARWTSAGYRAQNLFFWPGVALVTLSPLIAWFGVRGMMRIWRQRPDFRWPLLLRGFASMELGEWQDATRDYDAILAAPPDAMAGTARRPSQARSTPMACQRGCRAPNHDSVSPEPQVSVQLLLQASCLTT
jgi:hypothetical protein